MDLHVLFMKILEQFIILNTGKPLKSLRCIVTGEICVVKFLCIHEEQSAIQAKITPPAIKSKYSFHAVKDNRER